MEKFNVAIIGCGSIGALKDDKFDSPTTENIFTHAHAVHIHPDAELIGVVDIREKIAACAGLKWDTRAYTTIKALVNELGVPDIFIIATPTETHVDILSEILHHKPKLVIAEKPLTENARHCKVVVDVYKEAGIPLLVNYTRRFDTTTQTIWKLFDQGYYGKAQACTVIYNRGLKRDGCHALDFIRWFFGDMVWGERTNQRYPIHDFSTEDPTYPYYMEFEKCPHAFMVPADGRMFSIFEIEMIFEKAIIRWQNSGLEITKRELISSPYGPYKSISSSTVLHISHLNMALLRLLENAIDHLRYMTPLECTGEDALAVHKMIENLNLTPEQCDMVGE